jgi:hypothetical protein
LIIKLDRVKDSIIHEGAQVIKTCASEAYTSRILYYDKSCSSYYFNVGDNKMEDILRDLKKFTSSQIIKAIENSAGESRKNWMLWIFKRAGEKKSNNKNYQFWIQDNHPIELCDNVIANQKLDYIHNNPVVAGIVESPEEYLYSSAKNYASLLGLIEVDFIR